MIMGMLHRDKLFSILLIVFFCISCSVKKDDETKSFKSLSENIIGGKVKYQAIFLSIVDTLNNWKTNSLFGTSISCDYSGFQVDSLLCFNKEKNKMVTCILENECNEDHGDGIHFLYGAKIKGNWYFFKGAYIFLPREMYVSKDKVHEPLSFTKLHEIAMKNIYNGYLKKDMNGQWVIDEGFFSDLTSKAWCFKCTQQAEWDSAYLSFVKRNWKKK
jgi:hypothetical protein